MIDLEPAPLWRRGAARLLDYVLGVLVWTLTAMWLVIAAWGFHGSPLELHEALMLAIAIVALGLVLHALYHVAFIGGCGQTPGKMALGITVVAARDGGRAGYWRALVRCVAGAISFSTFGVLSIGMLFTRYRRGFPDLLAGTRVIRA